MQVRARRFASVAVVAIFVMTPVGVSRAGVSGDIFVTTFDDEILPDGDCSLREAVIAANTDAAIDACAPGGAYDHIFLQIGTYNLSIPGGGEDAAMTGDLDVLSPTAFLPVRFDGRATIDGGGLDRIFDVHASVDASSFTFLILVNGDAGSDEGGAIRVADRNCDLTVGSTDISSVLVEGNRARIGGGIHVGACGRPYVRFSSIVGNVASEVGGGISLRGDAAGIVETSTISGNSAGVAGGGVWAEAEETRTYFELATVADNAAPDGAGVWSDLGIMNLHMAIIATNRGPNCSWGGEGLAQGLADDDTCGGAVAIADAGLLSLARVGDEAVHLLADDSPAIELGGVPIGLWCFGATQSDQIHTARPQDGDGNGVAECDYGAIEHPAVPLVGQPSSPEPSQSPRVVPDTAIASVPTASQPSLVPLAIAAWALLTASVALRNMRRSRVRHR